ncbi:radical SAM protein, partial [candidate division CSSED10-310 bacterium]
MREYNFRTNDQTPSYFALLKNGELAVRTKALNKILEKCELCPRRCHVNRLNDEKGECFAGKFPVVSSHGPHFGEEAPLVAINGSGTIFFAHCNLLCVFCQNYDISYLARGDKLSISQLAKTMMAVQMMGCHNLNFVTPTHFVPQMVEALAQAIDQGFKL